MMAEMGKKKNVKIFSAAVAVIFCPLRSGYGCYADGQPGQCRTVQ